MCCRSLLPVWHPWPDLSVTSCTGSASSLTRAGPCVQRCTQLMARCFGLLAISALYVAALDNGVAQLPRMGWSSYNVFGNTINETLIRQQADALVSTGLRDLGFNYVHLDAGALSPNRSSDGKLQHDKLRFPSGLRALGEYLHARGFKFGLYTDIGNTSCGSGPGSYGHYSSDAASFAEWQIDALKVDFCDFWFIDQQLDMWRGLRDALNATGRPIWLYTSPHSGGDHQVSASGISAPWHNAHPYSPPPDWDADTVRSLANSMMFQYVNLFDYWWAEHWGGPGTATPPGGLLTNIDAMNVLQQRRGSGAGGSVSGPGFWADAQQLEVCNFGEGPGEFSGGNPLGMSIREYRAHYSIWAMFASPMVLSFDVTTIQAKHPECLDMVKSRALLAIVTDSLGEPGQLVHQATNLSHSAPASAIRTSNIVEQVWTRRVADGGHGLVVCLFNRAEHPRKIWLSWPQLGLSNSPALRMVEDLWGSTYTKAKDGYGAVVEPHGVVVVKIMTTNTSTHNDHNNS